MTTTGRLTAGVRDLPDHAGVYADSDAGPASYSSGGFTITTPATAAAEVDEYVVSIDDNGFLGGGSVIGLDTTVDSSGDITVVVEELDTTAATPAWAQVANATDLSSLNFTVIAVYDT